MALSKQIEFPSGMSMGYHRIVSLGVGTNVQNTIEVGSYASEAKRAEEIEALEQARETGEWPDPGVLVETTFYPADYDQDMTIDSAYAYLKGLPEFEGAQDC